MTGVRRAHQPAQQLLLQGFAEQAAPAGGERFVALLGDNLQVRRGDVGQLDYSQEEAVAADSGPRFRNLPVRAYETPNKSRASAAFGKRDRVNEWRAEELSARSSLARFSSSARSRSFCVIAAARSNSARASSAASELGKQIAADARQQVIVLEHGLGRQRVDDAQPGLGAEQHGQRHGAVELDDRRRHDLRQLPVETDDARPIGRLGGVRTRMAGGNGSLQDMRAGRRV